MIKKNLFYIVLILTSLLIPGESYSRTRDKKEIKVKKEDKKGKNFKADYQIRPGNSNTNTKEVIKELVKKYNFVSQEENGIIKVRPVGFMDHTNIPSFKIYGRNVSPLNWKNIYENMALEEFKDYIESIARYKRQLNGEIGYITRKRKIYK